MTETAAAPPLAAVLDPIHEEGMALLRGGAEVVALWRLAESERAALWPRLDALVVRTSPVPAALIGRCPRLKVIAKHGVGVDNIDIAAATALGVVVFNTPGANALAVAEGAVALMLAVVKRLRAGHDLVAAGRFAERGPWRAGDLSGKTLGLVGGGRIAAELARICGRGFAMRVLVYDPYAAPAQIAALGAKKVEALAALLAEADIVSIHVPLTETTRGLLDGAALARMKPGAVLINTARGGIVDEAALAAALADGRLAGAGIDVFEHEPPEPGNPLLALPNVVLSPHVAGITEDSARRMAIDVAEGTLAVLAGERSATMLNPEMWERRRG
ncbi:MAG: hydroxyacid dehydrogenase [Rhodospirillaceae bacterium]|nr:hydroxyacid dehydrogenase [Rhodospirillaceae bacterium]